MLIFADLKQGNAPGVELFVEPLQARVVECRSEDQSLILDRAQAWVDDAPILCDGRPLPIIHADSDQVWLDHMPDIPPQAQLVQVKCTGLTQDILEAFEQAWSDRWNKHQAVPENQWNDILQFARDHLPRNTFTWDSLTAETLAQCIRLKKNKTSKGLDGISLRDLKAMPSTALQALCEVFDHAEQTGEWPTQLLQGRVSPIAKQDQPQGTDDYRPITILPLLYRCWGTWRARKAIRALDPHLSLGLHGSRPGHHAGMVWTKVLFCIEEAYHGHFALSGVIADLTKAFNLLPRQVVMEGLGLAGLPFKLLRAWCGALTHMQRFFQVHGALGRPIESTCGFPEGDALSVVAMIQIDELLHRWLQASHPMVQPLTYADDWQLLTVDDTHLSEAFDRMVRFSELIRVPIDAKKTHFWATDAQSRAALRQRNRPVIHHGRALGAHMQFTRQHTNAVQMQRVLGMKPFWPRLKVSTSPYHIKTRAIRMAAWPRALHGIAATLLSNEAFRSLRTGALTALGSDGAGVNPTIHLSLVEDYGTDPLYWAILTTLRTARSCGEPEVIQTRLAQMVQPMLSAIPCWLESKR